ncbi:hypothetical protein KFK09_017104 [Dendrobium nobile]|uniref:Uncharacterized protein n=1 Tax=Dendrobium nobile TaxID=94219 RepID=A0A8T3B1A0_DENNO|nr:hypothetical protein KFK09_017104 [Dendrobium nobile]
MGSRIDELEQSINDLKTEMGGEVPIKKPEEPKNPDNRLNWEAICMYGFFSVTATLFTCL